MKSKQQNIEKRHKTALALIVGLTVIALAPAALAAVPAGLGAIESKARDIEGLIVAIAAIIAAIGAVWCGIKFIKGDQDSWAYVWKFGLGAIIVGSSSQIVGWITGS